MIQIIPAVLATNESQYRADITKLSLSESLVEGWVHIDFADNKFVQNQTIEPEVVANFPINFRKEAHLMVSNPKEWIDKLAEAGFERVIMHLETENINEAIDYAKDKGLVVGLAIKDETEIEKLDPFISKIDTILIMSIVPGFQGQPFLPSALKKLQEIKEKGWGVRVGVDGAVRDDNIKEIVVAGADFVTVGSYLLKGNVDEKLENLWEVLSSESD